MELPPPFRRDHGDAVFGGEDEMIVQREVGRGHGSRNMPMSERLQIGSTPVSWAPFNLTILPMSVTLDLPPELESAAMSIPDLNERLLLFVRQQVNMEQWRQSRYGASARGLLEQATLEAELARKAGVTREQAAADFEAVHSRITSQL